MANHLLKASMHNVLKKLYSKKGDIFAEIMLNWKAIVGENFAAQVVPINIKYYKANDKKIASLSLKIIAEGNRLELQFSQGIIQERINNYLGYNAISKIQYIA